MKTLLLSLVLSLTTSALAAGSSLFSCGEAAHLANPLNIQSLLLDVSNEDPVATMKLLYKNAPKTIKSGMDYSGTSTELELMPEKAGLDLTILLAKNKSKGWTAKVTNDKTNTVSMLSCDKDKMNVADFADEVKAAVLFNGILEGELEDLGGNCTVEMKKEANGSVTLQLKSDSGLQFAVTMKASVKVERKTSNDDSVIEYKSEYKTITIVDAEDAYQTISISNASTKLTCGVYF